MKSKLLTSLEFLFLLLVLVLLVAFIGGPTNEVQRRSVNAPPAPSLKQGSAEWDRDLVLPDTSERIVHYTMDVRLDTATNIISGTEELHWKNTTGKPQSVFPFHLYHNAWKNNRSTFAKEQGYQLGRDNMRQSDYGYTNIKSMMLLEPWGETELVGSLRYIHPDDDNAEDQTVCEISTPRPISAGRTLKLRIVFETRQPLPISRTGAIRNFHFAAQWFPKIGVWWKGAWNCHQFHANTEFFADYGVYDVRITVPPGFVVGATGGIPTSVVKNSDATTTHRFQQSDVHDFAWVASPDIIRSVRTFLHKDPDPGERPDRHHPLKDVKVILYSQPHRQNMVERYFTATFNGLRYFGEWYGEYPYETVSVVDPANDSRTGGMEYPTLFTGRSNMFSPQEASSPEGVTVHEFGHQFWYGLVGNNEFEEAWLDEGFNTYSTDRVIRSAWGPFKVWKYYFGGFGADAFVGIPHVFDDVDQTGLLSANVELRMAGKNDVMARSGWEYYRTYGLNSYTKPGMSLLMLERILGEETMYRLMRTYQFRYRFRHPTSEDFIQTVNEVTGKDMRWFFEQTWYSSNLFDYSIDDIVNRKMPTPAGLFDGKEGEKNAGSAPMYECEVVVKREGEAMAPVDVLVVFNDGEQKHEEWDGQYRWKKFVYHTNSPVQYAVVDPERKIVMDVNWNNNSKFVRDGSFHSLAARKYASKFLFWAQVMLETLGYWN